MFKMCIFKKCGIKLHNFESFAGGSHLLQLSSAPPIYIRKGKKSNPPQQTNWVNTQRGRRCIVLGSHYSSAYYLSSPLFPWLPVGASRMAMTGGGENPPFVSSGLAGRGQEGKVTQDPALEWRQLSGGNGRGDEEARKEATWRWN